MVPSRWLPFVLTGLLLVPVARAADSWPVPRGPSHEIVPFRYDPKKAPAVPREFLDDAAACILYAGNSYSLEPDGTLEVVTHDVTRLNGRKGIEKVGEYRGISYDPSYQKLTLNEARVHKADGRVVQIEPRHVQFRDVSTDYLVYDHDKQLIISFPSLEVGDTIEVKWTVRGKHPEHAGHFFTRYSFGDTTFPVVLDELRVRVPKSRSFTFASVNGKIEPVRTADGDFVVYHWKASNCKRPPQDDNLPPKEELRQAVACSTFASWEDVGRWKQRLRSDCWACTPDLRKVVQEVTRGLTDQTARARALTYWLRRNIRYVSAGEKHDYTPHLPGEVLGNRYGDCKDTSQMLAVMLREAGIQVELATLGVTDDGQVLESVPSPWGTHAILLATIGGRQHWIDTTSSLAGWDFLPRDDRDRLCYLVDNKGKIRLQRTPPAGAAGNRFDQTTHVWVGADGSSRCERTVIGYGSAGMGQRDTFLEVPSGERRRQVTAELQDANNQTRLVRLNVDEASLRDFDAPTTVRMVYEIPNHFTGSPDREGSISDSKVWSKLVAHNIDYDRTVALYLPAPFESRHRYVVHVHPAFSLETVPVEKTVESPWGTFTRRVTGESGQDGLLELEFYTRLDKVRVEPGDFERFRQFQDDVSKGYRAWLTLKPAQDQADLPLLEALLQLTPEDGASAAALARLYQQGRRQADARRVLERARFYQPDDATLWELSVKSAGSPEAEEKVQRELVRRFPAEGRYTLALADVLIQRSQQPEARKLLLPLTKTGTAAGRAQALFYLARSHYRTDELEPALRYLTEAGKVDPDTVQTVRAYQLKGQILEELGRPRDAVLAYTQALAINHEATAPLDALVRLMLADNKPDEALTFLRRYVVAVGDEVSGLLLAAEHYLRLKQEYDEAFALALRARGQQFDDKANRILGLVSLQRGELTKAVAYLEKASPDAAVLDGIIRAYLVQGNVRRLAAQVEQGGRLDKATPELREAVARGRRVLQRAEALNKEGCPPGKEAAWGEAVGYAACAEEAFREGQPAARVDNLVQQALGQGVQVGLAYALRGRLALDQGKLHKALADADQALRLSPGEAGGHYVRGRVRLERDQPGALAELEKAAELSRRQDADVLHALADALARAGKVAEALTIQRLAVKIKPHDKDMAEQLDTLEKRIQAPRSGT